MEIAEAQNGNLDVASNQVADTPSSPRRALDLESHTAARRKCGGFLPVGSFLVTAIGVGFTVLTYFLTNH